jgi:multiple sugar transport system substrate-binding protein
MVLGSGLAWLGPLSVACRPLLSGPQQQSAPAATVRWPVLRGPRETAFAEEFARRFNAKYGPRPTLVPEGLPAEGNREIYEKWVAMAVANQLPEILQMGGPFVRPFILKGLVLDLNPLIRRDAKQADIDDFYKSPLAALNIEGKQYGLPRQANNNVMYVNKNLLREAALPYPPEDWGLTQFLEYVTKLTRRQADPSAGAGQGQWGYDMPFTGLDRNITWIWNHGGEPHDPNDGPIVTRLTYDHPKTIEGLQFLHDLIWKQRVSPANNGDRGGLSAEQAFIRGQTAIFFNAFGDAYDIGTGAAQTGLDWDFLPLVKGPGGYGSRHPVGGWLIDRQTRIPDAAWTAVREIAGREGETLAAQLALVPPMRRSAAGAWEQLFPGKNTRLFRTLADTARPDPRALWKDSEQVQPIISGKYMRATFQENQMSVAEAMRRAMDEVRRFYAGGA